GWPGAAATERGTPRGVVHDPVARAMGGVSSHAGLFGAAAEVARLAEQVVDAADGRPSAVPGRYLAGLWAAGHRGGWDRPSPGGATGGRWPADTVGHLGYTGTSVWVARRERVVVALLTNRVHPDDAKDAIRIVRPRIHDAVAEELGW
ncbi:MAG: serine hydrolase, partial [Myxococcota bacterium]